MTEFFEAIKNGDQEQVLRLLSAAPNLIHENENGVSPILLAIYYGHPEIAEFLAEKKVVLDIFEAAAMGKRSYIVRILAREPDLVHAYSNDGYQPLGLACFFGRMDVVEYLIGAGARLNSPSKKPMNVTPLHSAAAAGHAAIVKLLLDHGASPNVRGQGGFTPLHAAAQNGDVELIRLLLLNGADAEVKTDEGKTPLDYARESNKPEAVELLLEGITKRLR